MFLSKLFKRKSTKLLTLFGALAMALGVGAAASAVVSEQQNEVVETKGSGTKTIYYLNSNSWGGTLYCHNWSGGTGTTWPGTTMEWVGKCGGASDDKYSVWKADIDADNTMCVFNNNSGSQTGDLSIGGIMTSGDGSVWCDHFWGLSGKINGNNNWVDDVYVETEIGSTVISGYLKQGDIFKLKYGNWYNECKSTTMSDLSNYILGKASSNYFTNADGDNNISVQKSGYYTFAFSSDFQFKSDSDKKSNIYVSFSPMKAVSPGNMVIWAATDDSNWMKDNANTMIVYWNPAHGDDGQWIDASMSHVYKSSTTEVHYFGFEIPDNATKINFIRRAKTGGDAWSWAGDQTAINTTSIYYVGITYNSEAELNDGEGDAYFMASVLTGFFTCGSSSDKTNGKNQYSSINSRIYSRIPSSELSKLEDITIVDYALGAYSGNGNSYTGLAPSASVTAKAKWEALPSGGVSSAMLAAKGRLSESPLTTTLWIVLASGLAGLAAIGTAYFVSKKKRHQA